VLWDRVLGGLLQLWVVRGARNCMRRGAGVWNERLRELRRRWATLLRGGELHAGRHQLLQRDLCGLRRRRSALLWRKHVHGRLLLVELDLCRGGLGVQRDSGVQRR
jgi:hypothetical protein